MEHPVLELIRLRRSVRQYVQNRPVPTEILSQIVEAGRYAPSGGNHQYSHFVVVTAPAALEELKALVRELFAHQLQVEPDTYRSVALTVRRAQSQSYDFMYGAPALVLVANRRGYPNDMSDSAAATENMILAASALGIGSCWVNQPRWLRDFPDMVAYLEKLGVPDTEHICAGLALGYSDIGDLQPLPRTGNRVDWIS